MRNIIFMLLPFFLVSCKNRSEYNIVTLLEEWEHKEVLFPKKMIFKQKSKDSILYNIQSEYKILNYVDSNGCTSCKLQLPGWKMLIEEMDSLYKGRVKFIFVFAPRNYKDISYAVLTADFNYPIYVDEHDSIATFNNFPSDSKYQTFLLNKNNRVVAIGNPIYNPQIRELYMKIISGSVPLTDSNKVIETKATFNKQSVDMGTFDWKQEKVADIILKNSGEKLLSIEGISSSCGCLSVEYNKEPIQPGKSLGIRIKYRADHPEYFRKTVTVYCNTPDSPLKIIVIGNAI